MNLEIYYSIFLLIRVTSLKVFGRSILLERLNDLTEKFNTPVVMGFLKEAIFKKTPFFGGSSLNQLPIGLHVKILNFNGRFEAYWATFGMLFGINRFRIDENFFFKL